MRGFCMVQCVVFVWYRYDTCGQYTHTDTYSWYIIPPPPPLTHKHTDKWRRATPSDLIADVHHYRTSPDQQLVMLCEVFADDLTIGYRRGLEGRIFTFNEQEVNSLTHLADMVDACEDTYMRFGLGRGRVLILERTKVLEASGRILERHAIAHDRSVDLRGVRDERGK